MPSANTTINSLMHMHMHMEQSRFGPPCTFCLAAYNKQDSWLCRKGLKSEE